MDHEKKSQFVIEREVQQSLERARELRKQAEAKRRMRRRINFAMFITVAVILSAYVVFFVILFPR